MITMKEYDDAIDYCDQAIEAAMAGSYDYVKLAKALARKANCYFLKGDHDQAIEIYKKALLENNDYAIKEALKKVERIKKDSAIKAYINPEKAEEHKTAGGEHFKKGDFVAALKEFDEGLRRDPNSIPLYSNRAAAYLKLMDPTRARSDAEKCISLDPNFVKGYARKGTAHQMQKEYHKAMEAFE